METLFSKKLDNNDAQCQTCAHFCVIKPGKRGICGVRENQNGQIKVLNYGKLVSANIDPIEKKPFFNFLPGTTSYSIAAAGCNFHCGHCQNWQISQIKEAEKTALQATTVEPKEVVAAAKATGCTSIAYTYTEPTIYAEFALDVMKLAREAKLKNVWVSNGFMSPQTRTAILPYLDAINIDLKSFNNKFYQKVCGASLKPVLENISAFKKKGVWIELTTLIIPTWNDQPAEFKQIADFIKNEVGPDTPWHISRFSPEISYQMQDLPTTEVATIKQALQIGRRAGLKKVYAGNVSNHELEQNETT